MDKEQLTVNSKGLEIEIPQFKNIDISLGLNYLANDKKLYLKILNDFINDYKELNIDDLQDDEFKRTIHTIKGLSANIGATNLHDTAKEIDETQNRELLPNLYKELKFVVDEITDSGVLVSPIKQDKIKEKISSEMRDKLFAKLSKAVSTKRPKQCEIVIEDIEKYNLSNEDKELFDKLHGLIKKYKFKEVETLLTDISFVIQGGA